MSFPVLPKVRTLHLEAPREQVFGTHVTAPIEDIIQIARWGTYGKSGKEPLKWVKLIDCETEHLEAILNTQSQISSGYRLIIQTILQQRKYQTKTPINTAMSETPTANAPELKFRPLNKGEEIRLGMVVRDTVTKITGWAYARHLHLQGCDHIHIAQPGANKEGKMKDLLSTDVLNLEIGEDQSNSLPYPPNQFPILWVGDKVADPITQRQGTITGYTIGLYCDHFVYVQPEGADPDTGKAKHGFHIEESRATLISKGPNHGKAIVYSEAKPIKAVGGPSNPVMQPD